MRGPIHTSPVARQVPFDNSSNSFVSTDVQSAIEEAVNLQHTTETTATAGDTTSSSTDALMGSMTVTPVAGTHLVLFNADLVSNAAGATISFSYYLGGTQIATSLRRIAPFDGGALSALSARGQACLQDIMTVSGSQAVEVRWSISSGTATVAARSLITLRVA